MKSLLAEILSPFPVSHLSISSAEFPRCLDLARLHGVEMLFYNRLKKHHGGSNPFIDAYLKKNENAFLFSVARSMRQEVIEKDVVTALVTQRVPACIIKGNQIARTIYEDPNCRGSADIDVLIRTTDLKDADRIITAMGFTSENILPLPFCIGRLHHIAYSNIKNNILLELHWDFGYPSYFNLTPDEIWKGVIGSEAKDYSLTPETMVIMLLTHHFRHGFREIKILVDILWTLYRYDSIIHWGNFTQQLIKYGLVKTTAIILTQLDDLWHLNEGPLQSFKILREQITSLPVHPSKFLLRYFKIDIDHSSHKSTDMQVAKLALDRTSNIFYAFVKIFFPRPRDIKSFYPGSKAWMLPFNYLRFFCWRVTKWRV
ncbi:MAG: nucleotidyltransferase family protein [Syntrophaceae bacterium]|nr:nucleotidyltransferase family protein [Syntrophaceae bacterium]